MGKTTNNSSKTKIKKSIEKHMEKWCENSRCQICVVWKKHLGGHTFVAERIDEKTRLAYIQINNVYASNYFKYCLTRKSYFYRIDNQNITEYIKDYFETIKKRKIMIDKVKAYLKNINKNYVLISYAEYKDNCVLFSYSEKIGSNYLPIFDNTLIKYNRNTEQISFVNVTNDLKNISKLKFKDAK